MQEHAWKFYLRGDAAWEAMLADCRAARQSIDFEQYCFRDDEFGERFIRTFIEKAAQGVKVRMFCDAVGSIALTAGAVERLRANGVQIILFKPLRSWMPYRVSSWFFRDHRKLLVVDGRIGYVGSAGIHARMHDWRETHVRIEERATVEVLTRSFERIWEISLARRFLKFGRNEFSASGFSVQTNAPHVRERFVRRALLRALREARKYAYLTTPYFVPSLVLLRAIRRARRRGADVRILVPMRSDRLLLDIAAGSYFDILLHAGIRVYRYRGPGILHAKTVAIDDRWGTSGSTNLDNLGLTFNYELNLTSVNLDFVGELKHHFLEDLRASEEVLHEEWKKRPLHRKALEALTWPIHGIL